MQLPPCRQRLDARRFGKLRGRFEDAFFGEMGFDVLRHGNGMRRVESEPRGYAGRGPPAIAYADFSKKALQVNGLTLRGSWRGAWRAGTPYFAGLRMP